MVEYSLKTGCASCEYIENYNFNKPFAIYLEGVV